MPIGSEPFKIIFEHKEIWVRIKNIESPLYNIFKRLAPEEIGKHFLSGDLSTPGYQIYKKGYQGVRCVKNMLKPGDITSGITVYTKGQSGIIGHLEILKGEVLMEPVITMALLNFGLNILNTAINGINLYKINSIETVVNDLGSNIKELEHVLGENFESIALQLENVIGKLDIISSEIKEVKMILGDIIDKQEEILQNQEFDQLKNIRAGYRALQDRKFDIAYKYFLDASEFYKMKIQSLKLDVNLPKISIFAQEGINYDSTLNRITYDLDSFEAYLLSEYGLACYYLEEKKIEKSKACIENSKKQIYQQLDYKKQKILPDIIKPKLERFHNSIPCYEVFIEAMAA